MYKFYETSFKNQPPSMREKLQNISFSFITLILMLAGMGVVMLYSAANGHWNPWALNQLVRFGLGFTAMIVLALIDIRFFMRYAYVFYFLNIYHKNVLKNLRNSLYIFSMFSGTRPGTEFYPQWFPTLYRPLY